jgi:hypothetical protein
MLVFYSTTASSVMMAEAGTMFMTLVVRFLTFTLLIALAWRLRRAKDGTTLSIPIG